MAVHPFLAHLFSAGQNPGPYPLKAPSMPVRGFDAPQRDALYIPVGPSAPVGGAGQICGDYATQAPMFFNVSPAMVVNDINAGSPQAGTAQKAGGLVDLSSLYNLLKG